MPGAPYKRHWLVILKRYKLNAVVFTHYGI